MSDAIREAFEAWWKESTGADAPPRVREGYAGEAINTAWWGFRAALQSSQVSPAVLDRDWLSGLAEEWRTYAHNNENASETHKGRGEANCAEVSWNRAVVFAQCADAVEAILAAAPQPGHIGDEKNCNNGQDCDNCEPPNGCKPDHSPDARKVVDECRRVLDRLNSSDPDFDDCADAAALIVRLQSELSGPDGFATWKDAALHERKMRLSTDAGKVVPVPWPKKEDITEDMRAGFERLYRAKAERDGRTLERNEQGAYKHLPVDSDWVFYRRAWADALEATHPAESREEIQALALEEFAEHIGDCIALWRMEKEEGLRGTISASEEWAGKMKRKADRLRASQQEGEDNDK